MNNRCLALADAPLRKTQSWQSGGVTVLTADIELPQSAPGPRRTRRFDRYYRAFLSAYLCYCECTLLPRAAESCRDAMARSAPWQQLRAEVRFAATFCGGGVLSLTVDCRERGAGILPLTQRRADVWDTRAVLPLPAAFFFPGRGLRRGRILRAAREQLPARWAGGGVRVDPDWRTTLRRAFNPRCFYLTDEGLCFFWPMYALADEISVVTLPFDGEAGPLPPERVRF